MKIETGKLKKMIFIIPSISIDYECKFISIVWLRWGIFIGGGKKYDTRRNNTVSQRKSYD